MTSSALTANENTIELILDLERQGALTSVSLQLSDPDMTYDRWESLGRFLGRIDRASRWWLGDWLNFGEELFHEEHAQAVESTQRERYSQAERVTGLDPQTLTNIRSICARVGVSRRREELGFWIHAEVAPLEPEEQSQWLQTAIDKGWTRSQLRDEIRAARSTPAPERPVVPPAEGEFVSPLEQLQHAARVVWGLCQPHASGGYLVPAEAMSQLRSALGED